MAKAAMEAALAGSGREQSRRGSRGGGGGASAHAQLGPERGASSPAVLGLRFEIERNWNVEF